MTDFKTLDSFLDAKKIMKKLNICKKYIFLKIIFILFKKLEETANLKEMSKIMLDKQRHLQKL